MKKFTLVKVRNVLIFSFFIVGLCLSSCKDHTDKYTLNLKNCGELYDFEIQKNNDSNYTINFNDIISSKLIIKDGNSYMQMGNNKNLKLFDSNDKIIVDTIRNLGKGYGILKKNINIINRNDNLCTIDFTYYQPTATIVYQLVLSNNFGLIQIYINDGLTITTWKRYASPHCNTIIIDSTFGYH